MTQITYKLFHYIILGNFFLFQSRPQSARFPSMIHPLVGHADQIEEIGNAIAADRFPQVILLIGPEGVGKQRLGLWVAQRLLCISPEGPAPCGHCPACHKVLNLGHPDLHWFVPIPRPKASDPDKQVDEAADSLAEILAERRTSSLYQAPDGMASHSVASARLLARRVSLTPVEGARKVILLGHADRLVPQESSPEAANALLKLLEEPPASTFILLTTTDAGQVLPTIRSRAVPIRLRPLPDALVRTFLADHLSPLPSDHDLRVRRAEGSIGLALAEGEAGSKGALAAASFLAAVRSTEEAYTRCLAQAPWQARGEFSDLLESLAGSLGDAVRAATGTPPRRPLPPSLRGIDDPAILLHALGRVQDTWTLAQGNGNPQLLLATLAADLHEVLA